MAPELSIIVPVLNEAQQLPCLLTDLLRQQRVDFELLVCDGGSGDGSCELVDQLQPQLNYPVTVVNSVAGRGRQLNAGVSRARGDWLLFLHVDSRFDDPLALRRGIDQLASEKSDLVAGRYGLRFRRTRQESSAAYYYYEWKARLDRAECIHGDQGMLLRPETFRRVGRFREDLPVMEDTDFAERLRNLGRWRLLPAEISTSARRFEEEGLWQRQLVNALIMCFRAIGWDEYFDAALDLYAARDRQQPLRVRPFFRQVSRLLRRKPLAEQWRIWYRSGSYVQRHAWQLLFALDARRCFRAELPVGEGRALAVRLLEPAYGLLTGHPPGRLAATLLLIGWFRVTGLWLLCKEGWRN